MLVLQYYSWREGYLARLGYKPSSQTP